MGRRRRGGLRECGAFLVAHGQADPDRLIIRGRAPVVTRRWLRSVPHDVSSGREPLRHQRSGALARETHKFESRYLDRLIGLYPDDRETYRARHRSIHRRLRAR